MELPNIGSLSLAPGWGNVAIFNENGAFTDRAPRYLSLSSLYTPDVSSEDAALLYESLRSVLFETVRHRSQSGSIQEGAVRLNDEHMSADSVANAVLCISASLEQVASVTFQIFTEDNHYREERTVIAAPMTKYGNMLCVEMMYGLEGRPWKQHMQTALLEYLQCDFMGCGEDDGEAQLYVQMHSSTRLELSPLLRHVSIRLCQRYTDPNQGVHEIKFGLRIECHSQGAHYATSILYIDRR
jgi:hypothetical protein